LNAKPTPQASAEFSATPTSAPAPPALATVATASSTIAPGASTAAPSVTAPAMSASQSASEGVPCPEVPAAHVASGTVVEIPFHLTLQDRPLQFAEANPLLGGGTLTPLDLRFYVSEVALLRGNADALPVDIVTSAGTVAPYGVHLFNADDETSTTLRLLVPAGDYTGMTFLVGLVQDCNVQNPGLVREPLTATSQMTWPGAGYLFLRYQGLSSMPTQGSGGDAGAGDSVTVLPSAIHMGGNLVQALVPAVRVEGALSVPPQGPFTKSMQVSLDELFKGALSDVDLTGFAGPPGGEVLSGERLRRSLPTLQVFSFER